MKSKYFILILAFLFSPASFGSVSFTADQRRAGYFQHAILLYTQKENRLPRSWDDLRNLKDTEVYVKTVEKMEIAGYENDFVRTFRFIPSKTEIKIRDGSERVVAMATRSMISERNGAEVPNYRLLVVQTKDKNIALRQLPEDGLDFMFAKTGFKLSEYTGDGGNWEPEKASVVMPLDHSEQIDQKGSALQNTTNQIADDNHRSILKPPTVFWAFGFLILSLLVAALWQKLKSQPGRQ
jgi:hypothetical protein